MSDIVEKLRDRGVCSTAHNSCRNDFVCEEAADEIERLYEETRRLTLSLARLRKALLEIVHEGNSLDPSFGEMFMIAKDALEERK